MKTMKNTTSSKSFLFLYESPDSLSFLSGLSHLYKKVNLRAGAMLVTRIRPTDAVLFVKVIRLNIKSL